MSTSALPPTSTEKPPTLYPSLLRRVSRAVSYNTLGEPFLVLIIIIILFRSFQQSLRAVFLVFVFTQVKKVCLCLQIQRWTLKRC